jgi:hypothetical protein
MGAAARGSGWHTWGVSRRRLDEATIVRLREFVPDVDLRRARIVQGAPWGWLPRAFGMSATTIGNNIIFRAGKYVTDTPRGLALIAHEVVHVGQVREAGLPLFVLRYIAGQFRCGFRHDKHPMEIPGIALQRKVRTTLEAGT